ncbi:MAG: DUF5752 family protein, partial [bacterium]
TGERARTLREMRDRLEDIDAGSIYYHFWGALLRPGFSEPEFNNDFASWARHSLHDGKTAERLAVVDPMEFANIEELRRELIEVIEDRLYEEDSFSASKRDQEFNFITSQIVVFDTGKRLHTPKELALAIPQMSVSSVFYHFIDARRRTDNALDDFSAWLNGWDEYGDIIQQIANVDPYFGTLVELRDNLAEIFKNSKWQITEK